MHLVGRDLMYSLANAEYLAFMRKNSLSPNLRKKLSKMREAKHSGGLSDDGSFQTVGYRNWMQGYLEAVKYVHDLLGENVDQSALEPPAMPSHMSVALGRNILSTKDHVGSLWNLCSEHSESDFSTLHMFYCVWFIEVGNVGGFDIFPLQCSSISGCPNSMADCLETRVV